VSKRGNAETVLGRLHTLEKVMRNVIHSVMLAAVGLLQVAIIATMFLGR
jgi:hypothetical protein